MTNRQLLLLLAVLAAVLIGCGRSNRQLITTSGDTAASAAFREKAQERWAALLNDPRTETLASYENGDERNDATVTEPPMLAENGSAGSRFNPVAGLRNLISNRDETYPSDPFLTDSADQENEESDTVDLERATALAERERTVSADEQPSRALQNQFDRLIANSNERLDSLERRLADSANETRTAALESTAAAFDSGSDAAADDHFVDDLANEAARANAQIDVWGDSAEDLSQMLAAAEADSTSGQSFDQLLGLEQAATDRGNDTDSAEVLLSQDSRNAFAATERNPFALASETAVAEGSDVSLPLLMRYADDEAATPFEHPTPEDTDESFEDFVATAEFSGPDAARSDAANSFEGSEKTDSFESFMLREEATAGLEGPSVANQDEEVIAGSGTTSAGLLEVPLPEDALSRRSSIPADANSSPVGFGDDSSEPMLLALAGDASGDFQPPLPLGMESGTFDQAFHGVGRSDDATTMATSRGLAVTTLSEPMVPAQDPPVWDVLAEIQRVSPRSWFFIIGCVVVVALLIAPRRSRRGDA